MRNGVYGRTCVALVGIVLGFSVSSASANCSTSKVRSLASEGRTATRIADLCDMDLDEVRDILDKDKDKDKAIAEPSPQKGLLSGQAVGPCGCWGPAMPGMKLSNPACQSRIAVTVACSAYCVGGGAAWTAICQ